ncbi:transposase [Caballeronia concitans]|uniref:ISPsy10, transposase, truncation n=1 Tax=Caballeronia concitans TaxID=1777133 RepID=A0A658R4A1_9BURK|nr:transposase [Caballeronia concitans]KIG09102.1 hypothetical protein BurMR1_3138 [Burkholderia sp. MR1]SAL49568.1 ISPsy10, transposase, truncation [Caballeronia concitans]
MATPATGDETLPTTLPMRTQRDEFLDTMDHLLPWPSLCAIVERHCANGAKDGDAQLCTDAVERMLRVCLVQSWLGLSDRGCADALIDSIAVQRFTRIDAASGPAPDARAIQQFRDFLQSQGLAKPLLAEVNGVLAANGIRIKAGTSTNARIVADIAGAPAVAEKPRPKANDRPANRRPQQAKPTYGDAYGSQSMRFRHAPKPTPSGPDASARIAQAIANIERIANRVSRPVPLPNSANR